MELLSKLERPLMSEFCRSVRHMAPFSLILLIHFIIRKDDVELEMWQKYLDNL